MYIQAYLENEVAESGKVSAIPAVQMTLNLLHSDGVLMLTSHLVNAARHADHTLKCALNHVMTSLHYVVVVDDVLTNQHCSHLRTKAIFYVIL